MYVAYTPFGLAMVWVGVNGLDLDFLFLLLQVGISVIQPCHSYVTGMYMYIYIGMHICTIDTHTESDTDSDLPLWADNVLNAETIQRIPITETIHTYIYVALPGLGSMDHCRAHCGSDKAFLHHISMSPKSMLNVFIKVRILLSCSIEETSFLRVGPV